MIKGVLYSSYFKSTVESIGIKIAVCRYLQSWMIKDVDYDLHLPELGPTDSLRDRLKNGDLTCADFYKQYSQYLGTQQDDLTVIKKLLDSGKDVTILCYESPLNKKKEYVCHRTVLSKAFLVNGYVTVELSNTTLSDITIQQLNDLICCNREEITLTVEEFEEAQKICDKVQMNTYSYLDANEPVLELVLDDKRILICGSRSITDYSIVKRCIKQSLRKRNIKECYWKLIDICCEAKGIDELGRRYAEESNWTIESFPAKWNDLKAVPCRIKEGQYGKYNALAGMNRNKDMVSVADIVIIIHDGVSKGTADDLRLCKEQNKDFDYYLIN